MEGYFRCIRLFLPVTLILLSVDKKDDTDLVGEKKKTASKRVIAWNDRTVPIISSFTGIICLFQANGKVDCD